MLSTEEIEILRLSAELAATKAKLAQAETSIRTQGHNMTVFTEEMEEAEASARVVLFANIIKNLTEMGTEETLEWIKSRGRFEIEKWEARGSK